MGLWQDAKPVPPWGSGGVRTNSLGGLMDRFSGNKELAEHFLQVFVVK